MFLILFCKTASTGVGWEKMKGKKTTIRKKSNHYSTRKQPEKTLGHFQYSIILAILGKS